MTQALLLKNCLHYKHPDTAGDLLIVEGRLAAGEAAASLPPGTKVLDCRGRLVTPGFIDVHIQGAGGFDVQDGNPEALAGMAVALVRQGVTGFLATTVIDPAQNNRHLENAAAAPAAPPGGAELLGLHLEGPFINPAQKGGLAPRAIRRPGMRVLEEILERTGGVLKMMTIAPELPGSLEIIRTLAERGIIASLGHSQAGYEETQAGIEAGIRHCTHIFNALPPLHHRQPGPLLAVMEDERLTAQIISDGVHVHPRMVRWLFRQLGPRRCIGISDGIPALGLPEGTYRYQGRDYEVREGSARYRDGTLIGTALSVKDLALRFRQFCECPLDVAVDTCTLNPARLLGISDRKGSLEPGKDADLVILNPDNSVWATFIRGVMVYGEEQPVAA